MLNFIGFRISSINTRNPDLFCIGFIRQVPKFKTNRGNNSNKLLSCDKRLCCRSVFPVPLLCARWNSFCHRTKTFEKRRDFSLATQRVIFFQNACLRRVHYEYTKKKKKKTVGHTSFGSYWRKTSMHTLPSVVG